MLHIKKTSFLQIENSWPTKNEPKNQNNFEAITKKYVQQKLSYITISFKKYIYLFMNCKKRTIHNWNQRPYQPTPLEKENTISTEMRIIKIIYYFCHHHFVSNSKEPFFFTLNYLLNIILKTIQSLFCKISRSELYWATGKMTMTCFMI